MRAGETLVLWRREDQKSQAVFKFKAYLGCMKRDEEEEKENGQMKRKSCFFVVVLQIRCCNEERY